MASSILPAEGVTIEFIARCLARVLLQPVVTGALFLASLRAPSRYREIVNLLSKDRINPTYLSRTIVALIAAGVTYRLNNAIARRVLNNWTSDNTWNWDREIVLVTGGCSGIGEVVVRKLSERNIKVAIFDVAEPRSPLPPRVSFYKVDITSSEAIQEAAQKVRKEIGDPTVLVNNAGIGANKPILSETEAQIRATFNVNIVAHFLLVREFVPYMIKQDHGHIVTIASMASFVVHASNVDYACTKAAALAFHEGLAQELKAKYHAKKVRTT